MTKIEFWTQKILGYASLAVIPIVAVLAIAKAITSVLSVNRGDPPKAIE